MKNNLAIAIATAAIFMTVISLVLRQLGVQPSETMQGIGIGVACIPLIRESLDRRRVIAKHPDGVPLVPPTRYDVPFGRIVLYGTLMVFAAMQAASFVGGVFAASFDLKDDKVGAMLALFAWFVTFPAVFQVGRWVGRHAAQRGLLAILAIAVITRIAATLFDLAMMTPAELDKMLSDSLGEGSAEFHLLVLMVGGVATIFVFGALGVWRGRSQRLGSYLGYLLRNVPDATKRAIVDLAYEEAGRARACAEAQEEARHTALAMPVAAHH